MSILINIGGIIVFIIFGGYIIGVAAGLLNIFKIPSRFCKNFISISRGFEIGLSSTISDFVKNLDSMIIIGYFIMIVNIADVGFVMEFSIGVNNIRRCK